MKLSKRTALFLATGAGALGLIGAGVGASFTASATANEGISVGTFGLQIVSTTTSGAVISGDGLSITYTAPTLQSSAAGSAPLTFVVKDTGSIPASNVHIVASAVTGNSNFSTMAVPADFALAAGGTNSVTVGLQWVALGNGDLGQSASITYTITATA